MRAVLFASLLVLAACQKTEEAAAPEAAGQDDPAVAATPQFQSSAVPFDAMSKTAEAATGNIRLTAISPTGPNDTPSMKLESDKGHVYETDLVMGGGVNARNIDWTGVFGDVVDPDDAIDSGATVLDIHAIATETAPNGGLCGKEKTGYLAVAFPIRGTGGEYMGIAAFKGDAWPPADTRALCGVFNYVLGQQPPQQ